MTSVFAPDHPLWRDEFGNSFTVLAMLALRQIAICHPAPWRYHPGWYTVVAIKAAVREFNEARGASDCSIPVPMTPKEVLQAELDALSK
jgi:hypothetical protein